MTEKKTVSDSYTEQVQILTQMSMNGYGRLFGGQLMLWIDVVAASVARRHCQSNVTTVLVDRLEFKKAAKLNDMVVLAGYVTYTGRTSLEVCVKTYVEDYKGEKTLINKAYVVLVGLDENDKPKEIPQLLVTTQEEKEEWEAAKQRKKLRTME